MTTTFHHGSDDELAQRYLTTMRGSLPRNLGLALFGAVLLILVYASIAYVPAGHVGVLTLFGRVTGDVLPEGTHLVNPFKGNNTMSIRTQELKETASVPSDEGLVMTLDTSLLFRLSPENAAQVYQKIGPSYVDVIVEPNMRSAIRSITAAHSASDGTDCGAHIRLDNDIHIARPNFLVNLRGILGTQSEQQRCVQSHDQAFVRRHAGCFL